MTNHQLAKAIEAQSKRTEKVANKVYALALHGHEKPSEIRERLGSDHPAFAAWDTEVSRLHTLYDQARAKVGPVMFNSLYTSLLRS